MARRTRLGSTLTRSPSPHLDIPIQVEHGKYDDEFVRHPKVNGIREGVKERPSDNIGDCGNWRGRSRIRVNVRSRSETKRAPSPARSPSYHCAADSISASASVRTMNR